MRSERRAPDHAPHRDHPAARVPPREQAPAHGASLGPLAVSVGGRAVRGVGDAAVEGVCLMFETATAARMDVQWPKFGAHGWVRSVMSVSRALPGCGKPVRPGISNHPAAGVESRRWQSLYYGRVASEHKTRLSAGVCARLGRGVRVPPRPDFTVPGWSRTWGACLDLLRAPAAPVRPRQGPPLDVRSHSRIGCVAAREAAGEGPHGDGLTTTAPGPGSWW